MIRRLLLALLAIAVVAVQFASSPTADAVTQMVSPTRVMDTRLGTGVRPGPLRGGEVVQLEIAGIAESSRTSVFLNLTTVDAGQPGFVTAWPCDSDRPDTSIVNFEPGRAVPNMLVVAYTGAVCFSASSSVHLIADVTAVTNNNEVMGIAPARLLDTRIDGGRLAAGVERQIDVAGTPGVPGDASLAGLNVTVIGPDEPGFVIVKPCGEVTNASTINFLAGEVVAHFVLSGLHDGAVCVVSSTGADVIVDSFAFGRPNNSVQTMTPTRVLDTRTTGPGLRSGETATVRIAGIGGVLAAAGAATVNIAVVDSTSVGYVAAWSCEGEPPLSSVVNLWPGVARANQATIKLSPSGDLCLRPHVVGPSTVDVVVDVVGFMTGTTTITLPTPITVAPPAIGPSSAGDSGTDVGSQSYPVPNGAIVVSPSGNDGSPGTANAPVRTVARGLALAPVGGTVVLRGGTYHETVTLTKRVTLQNWPGEAAWFDGARPVTGWVADGNAWRVDGWNLDLDTSPTYTRGAADSSAENWGFVDPNYPLAAHPDQVFVDGASLRQVGSRGEVGPGTFFHDRPGNRLYIGNDPNGHNVDASVLVRAIQVRADGSVLRGFGIRRYSPSVPDMGSVTIERTGVLVEHVAITDAATTGLSVITSNATVRNVYVARSGMLGIHANHADNLVLDRVLSENNNLEHFNQAPVSGGTKVTRTQGTTVVGSVFRNNLGPGLWFDESTYNIRIAGIETRDNAGHGISLEISSTAVLADSIIAGNGGFGVKVNDISNVRIWNNTFVGNGRPINIVQDNRRYGDGSAGVDTRIPNDPNMTWLNGPVEVFNNVIANPTSGNCLLCVEDYSRQRTAEQIGVQANGNVYNRRSSSSPSWVVIWSRGSANPATYTTLDAFKAATGQEAGGVLVTGGAVVDANGAPTAAMPSITGVPLPGDIAAMIGQAAGSVHVGAF